MSSRKADSLRTHWLTIERILGTSNVLAPGGQANHFCSVSCEIKRLLIVFINQYDQSSAVENLELHQILGQNWTGVKSGAVIMATSFVTEV